jgi:hypothetical protein
VHYTPHDFQKYVLAKTEQMIEAIRVEVEHENLDFINYDELDHLLDQVQMLLHTATFATRDGVDPADGPEPVGRGDVESYSDGRPVETTLELYTGSVTHIWHPDPFHADSMGQVFIDGYLADEISADPDVDHYWPGYVVIVAGVQGALAVLMTDS